MFLLFDVAISFTSGNFWFLSTKKKSIWLTNTYLLGEEMVDLGLIILHDFRRNILFRFEKLYTEQ